MKAGVFVHSQTGMTKAFAEMAAKAIVAKGHQAEVVVLEPDGEVQPHQKGVRLKAVPHVGGYDVLLIGGPIWAFAMSPVALAFAQGLKDLGGRRVLPFATMASPFRFMGGLQGIRELSKAAGSAGATVLPGVVGTSWAKKSSAARAKVVERVLASLGSA
jgi:flavodoxin